MTTKTVLRVLCFGGRKFNNRRFVEDSLDKLRASFLTVSPEGVMVVIHGGATGADTLAGAWGIAKPLPVIRMDAPWFCMGPRAGHTRNQWMLDYAFPTYAVAFPGGPGTADMAARCTAAGLPLWTPEP